MKHFKLKLRVITQTQEIYINILIENLAINVQDKKVVTKLLIAKPKAYGMMKYSSAWLRVMELILNFPTDTYLAEKVSK